MSNTRTRKPGGGRKPSKPEYSAAKNLAQQIEAATDLYTDKMSLQAIADALSFNPIKVRKLLITAGVYESDTAKLVQRTFDFFRSTQSYSAAVTSTMSALQLSRPSVTSYLPYEKGVYFPNTADKGKISVGAERQRRYRAMKRWRTDPTEEHLWEVVLLYAGVRFKTYSGLPFTYEISNLQKMAETLVWVQENNINDLTELNDLCKTAQSNAQAAYERLSQAEDELYKTNEQIHYAGQYLSTKDVQQQFAKAIFKKKFRAEHSKELDAYAESVKYFREENDGKLPSLKSLKKRKEELTKEIAERKKAYAPLREESRRLEIASDNVYSIFRKTNEMKSDLAWKREWEAKVREKARQEQARQEQRERQPKRKKRSYDMSL